MQLDSLQHKVLTHSHAGSFATTLPLRQWWSLFIFVHFSTFYVLLCSLYTLPFAFHFSSFCALVVYLPLLNWFVSVHFSTFFLSFFCYFCYFVYYISGSKPVSGVFLYICICLYTESIPKIIVYAMLCSFISPSCSFTHSLNFFFYVLCIVYHASYRQINATHKLFD